MTLYLTQLKAVIQNYSLSLLLMPVLADEAAKHSFTCMYV